MIRPEFSFFSQNLNTFFLRTLCRKEEQETNPKASRQAPNNYPSPPHKSSLIITTTTLEARPGMT
jgi:hypothetical protein